MSNNKPWEEFSITPVESSEPWNDYEPTDEPAKDRGFTGALIDGAKSTGRAISSTYNTYTGDSQAVVDNSKEQELANEDKSQDIKNFQSDFAANTGVGTDDEVGLWGAIKGTGKAIIDNPRGAALSVVEQFPNSVPTLAAGWAGAKGGAMAGGAVGSAFGGVGAGPGALIGGAAGFVGGMFLGNTLTETGHKAQEYAADGEFTPGEQSAAMTEGAKKAGVITAVDALTFGIGGKVSSTMRRTAESAVEAATRKTLIDAGVDISDTAALAAARSNPQIASQVVETQKNAARIADSLRKRAAEAGVLLTLETIGEGLGEYLGELAATGQASVSEAVLESFLSLGQSGVQTMFNLAKARDRSLTDQEWVDAANGIAPEGIAPEQLPVADGIWDEPTPEAKIDMGQMQGGGVTPTPVFDPQDIDRNLGPTPSQQMGINPDAGPLSAAAAQSVDSGLFVGGFTPQAGINQSALEREGVTPPPVLDADQIDRNLGSIDPVTGEYMPAPEQLGRASQAGDAGNYEYDQWGNLSRVDGRTVEGYGQNQPRLGFNSKAERSTAPLYEVGPDGVARPSSGEAARSRKERIDLSSLKGRQQTQAQKQPAAMPEQRSPEQQAQSIWDSMNTFERNAAATKVLGMRGVPAKNAATKAWDKLSPKQQAKLTAGLDAQQGQRWTDPNQKVADQVGPVLQNRDRTSQDSINQMRSISNNPDYSRLKTSGFLSDGAPVVVDESIQIPASQMGVTDTASAGNERFNVRYAVVEADQLMTSNSIDGTTNAEYQTGAAGKARAIAGNGRITGLQSAWAKGNASQYKADMAADRMHGIDPAVIEGMRNPILVRLLPQDQVTDNIGDLSNRDEKGRLSPVEQAKTDMGRIDLDSLKFTADGAIGGEAIHQFRMAQPAAERVTEAEARKRLTSAIFQKAYGNDQLTEIQSGESDDAKSILSALAQAAPSMSRLEGAGEFDVRPLITQAGIAAVNAARRSTKLADYVQQSEMGIDPMVYPILEMMLNEHGNIRSSKYIGEQLTNMAKLAYDEANSPSSDMFGEKPKRTAEQVIQDALTGVQGYGQINDGRGQESLGQRGRSEPDAQMVEGPEGGRERPADTRQTAPTQPEAEQEQPAEVTPWGKRSFTLNIDDEYGPPPPHTEAYEAAKSAPSGSVTHGVTIRPSGKQWHNLYLSHSDGSFSSVSIGRDMPDNLTELIEKGFSDYDKKQKKQEQVAKDKDAVSIKETAIAKENNLVLGRELGTIIPNTGKQFKSAKIIADHGDGTFTLRGVQGNKQAELRGLSASSIVRAVDRYNLNAGTESEAWRSNYIQAAKIARGKGIDPKQHKKLADLVAAIDDLNDKPELAHPKQPQQQVAAVKPSQSAPDLDLTQQTEQGIAQREAEQAEAQRREEEAKRKEEERYEADRELDDFTLTGSDRVSDVAAARGQNDMFSGSQQTDRENTQQSKVAMKSKRPKDYGKSNKLVSADRAEVLRERLRSKLRGQLNSGFDPEILAIGAELAAFHIEAGARKFSDFAKAIAQDLDMTPQALRQYLRSWYNGARDMMEDSNVSIEGMDSPEAVRTELRNIIGEAEKSSEQAKVEESHEPSELQTDIANKVLKEVAKDDWQTDTIKQREILGALHREGYPVEQVADTLGIPREKAGSLENVGKMISHIYEDKTNAEPTPRDSQSDSTENETPATQDDFSDEGRGRVGQRTVENGQTASEAEQKAGNALGNSSDTATGKRSNKPVRSEKSKLEEQAARDTDDRGSLPSSTGGLFTERESSGVVGQSPAAAPARVKKLNVKPSTKVKTSDLAQVKEQMPFLTEGQAKDVVFAEKRLSKEDGYGVLFTNGTGTGKTFSGLGVAKRMAMQGKDNILIVAPKQTIADAWIDAGTDFFGLDVTRLEDTNDAGKGIVITTYANMGENDALVGREWDAVIADEAHYLSSSQAGKETAALKKLRAITLKSGVARSRVSSLNPELVERQREAAELAKTYRKSDNQELWHQAADLEKEVKEIRQQLTILEAEEQARIEQVPNADKPRAVFLSATPFAYEQSVIWANEFLFDWGKDSGNQAYNAPSAYESFMQQHFGYRMRYNKLTQPDAKVDSGLMQRAFNSWLKKEGALSGRALDSNFDYDRKFVYTENALGRRVDEAIDWFRENGHIEGVAELGRQITEENFKYQSRMYFLEAIKAQEAIPIIREHIAEGRKVVVMHDFKKGGVVNPFRIRPDAETADAYGLFQDHFSDLIEAFSVIPSPVDLLSQSFPDALIYNGDVTARNRVKMQNEFNSDADGSPKLIVAQGDAMREGVSIHDTSGKHPRVMIHLGMPVKPTAAIQQEGRIYRTGQASNAMFRYLTIGSNWERSAFASKIASRAGAAENLAMGEEARGLKDSFINAYENADSYPVGFDGEGTGGREADQQYSGSLSPWDMAKAIYYGTKKQGRGRGAKGREHSEFFATPEPLGMKMVQWADIRGGERALEPSAGHGAIARWLPENTENRAIEYTHELSSKLALHFDGDLMTGDFMEHHIVNKYDAIVMNPPFGRGGADAAKHVGKAIGHLNDGGRVVALIPNGPAADKRFAALLESEEAKDVYLAAEIMLPNSVFERAGTSVSTRVIVLEKQTDPELATQIQQSNRDYSNAENIDDFFDRLEDSEISERLKPVEQAAEEASVPTENQQSSSSTESWEAEHSKTGDKLYMVKPTGKLERDEYRHVASLAKENNGYWSRFGKSGFLFKTEEDRQAFIEAAFSASPQFSRSTNRQPAGINEQSLINAISEQLPSLTETTRKLLALGKAGKKGGAVLIESNTTEGIARAYSEKTGTSFEAAKRLFAEPRDINGFYDAKSGLVFLVGPNLDAQTAAGVMLHELIHSNQRKNIDDRALEMIQSREGIKDAKLKAFLDSVAQRMEEVGEAGNASEATSYIVEQAVNEAASKGYQVVNSKFMSWVEQTFGAKIAGIVRDFVKAVRQFALRNNLPLKLTVDDLVHYAIASAEKTAGSVQGTAGARVFREAVDYSFVGQRALTADHESLSKAQARIAKGDNSEQVRKDTGWMKGVDGKWRFEIDDSKASFIDSPTFDSYLASKAVSELTLNAEDRSKLNRYKLQEKAVTNKIIQLEKEGGDMSSVGALFGEMYEVKDQIKELEVIGHGEFTKLGEVLSHKQLFEAYPELKNVSIRLSVDEGSTTSGRFNPSRNLIEMTAPTKDELLSGVLHEVQHAIQQKEGFARGGSTRNVRQLIDFELSKHKDASEHTKQTLETVSNLNQVATYREIIQQLNKNPEHIEKTMLWYQFKPAFVSRNKRERAIVVEEVADKAIESLTDEIYNLAGSGYVNSAPDTLRKEARKLLRELPQGNKKALKLVANLEAALDKYNNWELYSRLAGEIEARNTQTRRNLTADERRAIPPRETQDIDDTEAIAVFDDRVMRSEQDDARKAQDEGHRQFRETEQAYGGRTAYDKAKASGKTKLNYQQWVQVRTPAFKDWFGDWENAGRERIDKARHVRRAQAGYKQEAAADTREAGGREDRNRVGTVLYGAGTLMDLETGEPRVFYHGTSEDIKAFNLNHPTRKDSGWLGRGVYVASDVRMANTYANTKNGSAAPNVMPVFIRSTSGLYQATLSDKQVGSGLSQENIDKATEALKQRGYDGAYLEFQSDSTIELVTYSVNNVKSASGNVGTFSAATDDISFSRSQTKTAAFKKQFGDSKVVDASGDPLLVYHGSGAKFATFDKNKRGATTRAKSAEEGFFFTSSKSLAYDFKKQAEGAAADLDAIRSAVEGLSDSQLESLASDIGRIASEDLDLEGREFFIDSLMDMYQYDTDINTWPEESNGTPKVFKKYIPKDILEPGAVHDVYLRIENPYEHIFSVDDDWHDEGAITRAISIAKKNGNDGVVLRNMVDVARADEKGNNAIRSDVYIAFEPDQIIQSEDSAGIRFSRSANPASISAAPNGMAAWDSPSASKFDDFVYKMQDKHVDTKRVIEAIRDTGKAISDDLDVYLQETLFHGRAAKRTQDFLNKEVNPLIEYMQSAKVEMSDLEEFLHARHAQEANALIAKRDPNMPDGGSGMTNAEAAKYLNSLNGVRRKQLENAAKFVDKIIGGTRETIVNYGLESQETVDGWTAGFKHYIPLQREDKDGQMGIGQGFSVKGKETKGRTGSTRKVVDILANVMMQRERAIVRGEKNRVAVAALGLAKDNPLPDFWQVDKVPTTRVLDKTTGLVRNQADPMYKSRDNAIVAKVNGQEHAILMNEDDPRAMRMAEALKNLDAAQLEGLLGATATATRYFAAVNTQYNPIFGVTNFVRDIQEAMLHLQSTPLAGQQARLFKNTFTAVGAVMKAERDGRKGNNATGKWGVLWEDFQNTGGQTGFRDQFSSSADRGDAIKNALTPGGWADTGLGKLFTAGGVLKVPLEVARKKAAWLFDLLSDYNTAMENGVRLSAYETGINAGMSKEQAAALAKGLTVNFNRKGQVTQQVGALYAFFNASVQGTARLGQSLFDMDAGKPKTLRLSSLGKKIVSGGVMLGASQAVLLAMAGFDDEEPPEFIRERNIIIPTGGKTYISIPMPLGYHVIANLGRIPMEFVLGGGKDGAKYLFNLMDVMADIYNPIGNSGLSMQTIAPTVLDPLAGLAENKDFSGRAIAKESFNRHTPGHALARDTASLPATWLAELVNYATGGTEFTRGELSPTPDQIDYLVGQLTGGVGRETTKFMKSIQATATGDDLPWHNIPLAGRFFGDADSDGAKQSAFYNNMDKVRKHAEEVKGLRAAGRISEAIEYANKHPQAKLHLAARAAEKQVKDMRDRKRDLEQAGAPREEIRALEKRMIRRMAQFVDLSAASK